MIRVESLEFSYPVRQSGGDSASADSPFLLRIPDLEIAPQRATAVVGPSGSGKTSLLSLLAGLVMPTAGKVTVNEVVVSGLGEAERRRFRREQIGFVFQSFELIEYLNVIDNILLPLRIIPGRRPTTEDRNRAEHLAGRAGIRGKLKRPVGRLSQGERQRVGICRALMLNPPLILADEPTGNLDPVISGQILDLLLDAVRSESRTLVMVTHDHSVLDRFDRVIPFEQFLTASHSDVSGSATASGHQEDPE